jgi:hypothetical protein
MSWPRVPSFTPDKFVAVRGSEAADPIWIPLEEDGTLLLSTLRSQFPLAIGLTFRLDPNGMMLGVRRSTNDSALFNLFAPSGGWAPHVFTVTHWPVADSLLVPSMASMHL